MSKQVVFNSDAEVKILRGLNTIANAVKSTLGPKGRNVIIRKENGITTVTKDGVTVAKEIFLEDKIEDSAAQLVKQASAKTADLAGDGTTTAVVLTQAIYTRALKAITAGANAMEVKEGIEHMSKRILTALAELTNQVESIDTIEHIGTISANGDASIGEMIASAMEQVGQDGVITVAESPTPDTTLEITEGMQFKNGYLSPMFINNQVRMQVELNDVVVITFNKDIKTRAQVMPILERAANMENPVLLVANDFSQDALQNIIINYPKTGLVPVKSPGYGLDREDYLKDIGACTGSYVVNSDNELNASAYGKVDRIVISKEATTLMGGHGDDAYLEEYTESVKDSLKVASSYDREKITKRIASLSGGVAVIYVGGHTEAEMLEKKDRIDDALHATRAAVEEGIVPGGGIALLVSAAACSHTEYDNVTEDFLMGMQVLRDAVQAPLRTIVENSGCEPSVVVNNVLDRKDDPFFGYDARREVYGDMIAEGIIDPAKVTRLALENAVSIAGLLISTNCVIV